MHPARPFSLLASTLLALALPSLAAQPVAHPAVQPAKPAHAPKAAVVTAPVTVTDNGRSWTLDNGIVKATVNKGSGSLASLIYHGVETIGGTGGYWEQTPQDALQLTNSIDIDPATNGGERAEISIKGVSGGNQMLGRGAPGGGTYDDMEIRYTLARGVSGIYVYAIFTHPASYRAGGVGSESRYIVRLSPTFDWITVDKDRNMLECAA